MSCYQVSILTAFRQDLSTKEVLTLGNLKFQREGPRLGFRKGWWESQHLHINWRCIAENRVAAADSEPVGK